MTCVVDEEGRLAGIITDGDLRRHMSDPASIVDRTAADVMTRNPVTVHRTILAAQALHILEQRKITSLVVVDAANVAEGVIHLHDLWRTELI
jgi:arabinose-5-phosphate isomerase